MAAAPVPIGHVREAQAFLEALFGHKPDDVYVVLWELASRCSESFTDLSAATRAAAGRVDVYVHAGLTREPFSGATRPSAHHIAGIPGVWADIDIAGPAHKRPGLPPTWGAALDISETSGRTPGLVVHSGHGMQCWWLFKEPWIFDDETERHQAATLVRAWDISLRERAKRLGWSLDAVGDLPRLMRLPGTKNGKIEPIVDVEQTSSFSARYSIDEFEEALIDGAWQQAERELATRRSSSDPESGDLLLDPNVEPPWAKLDALREIEPRAEQAWRRKATSRTLSWTGSEYDMSLASYCAQAGFSRQEIANTIIAVRRKHGDNLKLRQRYYADLVDKVTNDHDQVLAARAIAATPGEAAQPNGDPPDTTSLLATVNRALGIAIARVTRSTSDPPIYRIETEAGGGVLGPVSILASNSKFRERISDLIGVFPRRLKNEQWDPIVQALLQISETDEIGIETTLKGQAATMVSLYLGANTPLRLDEMDPRSQELLPIRLDPFIKEGKIHVFASGFRRWLRTTEHESLTPQQVGTMLREWGCLCTTMGFWVPGHARTTRSVWVLPDSRSDEGTVDQQ